MILAGDEDYFPYNYCSKKNTVIQLVVETQND